jgi:hypothetical protein
MRKKFVLLVVSAICTLTSFAQEKERVPGIDPGNVLTRSYVISIGPKVGANLSTMSELDGMDLGFKSGIGFNGGIAANIHFGRRTESSKAGTGWFGIQMEALYSQRVVKSDFDDIKLSYFEVPVLAQCYITPNISVEVGPTVAGTLSSSPDYIQSDNTSIATGEIKGFDVMLTAGLAYKHKGGFTASARYNIGTSDLAGNFPCKMNMLTISVGWLFSVVK